MTTRTWCIATRRKSSSQMDSGSALCDHLLVLSRSCGLLQQSCYKRFAETGQLRLVRNWSLVPSSIRIAGIPCPAELCHVTLILPLLLQRSAAVHYERLKQGRVLDLWPWHYAVIIRWICSNIFWENRSIIVKHRHCHLSHTCCPS